jgi:hypothetical protein
MKIDVTQDALLRALVEAIREERDHGGALMRLMLRLVNEASKQGWFETHWRTEARLKLAQLACGDIPNDWRSAAPALDVIAQAARWALKAEQVDTEARAALIAITRLVDIERSGHTGAEIESRTVATPARRRKAKSTGQARRRTSARPAKSAGAAKVSKKARPASKARPAARSTSARKANGAAKMSKGTSTMSTIRTAAPAKGARKTTATKARPAAKSAARKANGAAKMTKARTIRTAKAAPKVSKARTVAKTAAARKGGAAKLRTAIKAASARKTGVAAKAAKKLTPQPAKVTKAQTTAKPASMPATNGQFPASTPTPAGAI